MTAVFVLLGVLAAILAVKFAIIPLIDWLIDRGDPFATQPEPAEGTEGLGTRPPEIAHEAPTMNVPGSSSWPVTGPGTQTPPMAAPLAAPGTQGGVEPGDAAAAATPPLPPPLPDDDITLLARLIVADPDAVSFRVWQVDEVVERVEAFRDHGDWDAPLTAPEKWHAEMEDAP